MLEDSFGMQQSVGKVEEEDVRILGMVQVRPSKRKAREGVRIWRSSCCLLLLNEIMKGESSNQ